MTEEILEETALAPSELIEAVQAPQCHLRAAVAPVRQGSGRRATRRAARHAVAHRDRHRRRRYGQPPHHHLTSPAFGRTR